jgi:hypothetical protein
MEEVDVLFGYESGLRSAADVVNAARQYRGDEPHFLWGALAYATSSTRHRAWSGHSRVEFLFNVLPEEKMYELLRAFVEDDPTFPLTRYPDSPGRRCGSGPLQAGAAAPLRGGPAHLPG